MHCPKCNTENQESRRFCANCGSGLETLCSTCNFANEPAAAFCGGCGKQLSQIEPASPAKTAEIVSGDRRQLTILFADLSGYTELADALDAEELHELMGRFFDVTDRIIENHGGTVHRHIGDEVMALFGTPIAHSDDPMRATRAAFEIHKSMEELGDKQGRPLTVHVGIASGNVVIAEQGTENPEDVPEYAITGAAANLAARLNSMAKSGETIISDTVHQDIEQHVACDALGEAKVKGFDKPVLTWRAKALQSKKRNRTDSKFIGRRAESAQFIGALDSCQETKDGQAILVRGEAGMGKTRLVEEFENEAEQRGFSCHKSLIFDFGVGEGQDAIRAMVSSLLSLPANSPIEMREAAAVDALTSGLCTAEQRVFLNDLLTLPQPAELQGIYDAMDNDSRHQGKHTLLTGLIQRVSESQPRLFVIEDVHWANEETLADIAHITMAVQDCPAVLVMTSRIEGDPLDQTWRGSTGGCPLLTIDIGPLRKTEAVQLAGGFSSAHDDFTKRCIERAAGNPLFLEQLLRNTEESGEEAVPATIQSLVLARIDRLSDADKKALQVASAIGQRFALDILQTLVADPDYSCAKLVEHQLVRPEGEDYLFAHALIQEGVYASLLKDKRGQIHRKAADWFSDRDLVLHAEHLDRAEDAAAAAAYLRAAKFKAADYHYNQASRLVDQGIAIAIEPLDKFGLNNFRASLLLDLGAVDESIKAYELALEFAVENSDRCQAWLGMAAGMRISDRYEDALVILDKADAAAEKQNMALERSEIHHLRGNLYFPMGRIEECTEEHEKSIKFARESGSAEAEANSLSGLGDASYLIGRMATAFQHFSRCVDVAQQNNLVKIEVVNRTMVGFTRLYLNQIHDAHDNGLKAIEMATKIGHQRALILGEGLATFSLFELAEYAPALEHNRKTLEIAQQLGASRFEAQSLLYQGRLEHIENRQEEAIKSFKAALEVSRNVGHNFTGPRIMSGLACAYDTPKEKRDTLAEGENMLQADAVSHNHLFFYREAIEVSLGIDDWDNVERYSTALENYAKAEPLPWSIFFSRRGRALATYGKGEHDTDLVEELQSLKQMAEVYGLITTLPSIEAALAMRT